MCKFSEGIKTIEKDHQMLFEGLNKLSNCTIPERLEISRFLVGYLTSHMFLEEYMMQLIDYPLIEEHKLAHKKIREAYISRLRDFIQGNDNNLIQYCQTLFEHHALIDDALLMTELQRLKQSIDSLEE